MNHLSFGEEYPGQVNPLDATEQTAEHGNYSNIYLLKWKLNYKFISNVILLAKSSE